MRSNQATKKLVNELVEKLKYRPNAVALSLRSRKTNTIALVVPEIVQLRFRIPDDVPARLEVIPTDLIIRESIRPRSTF